MYADENVEHGPLVLKIPEHKAGSAWCYTIDQDLGPTDCNRLRNVRIRDRDSFHTRDVLEDCRLVDFYGDIRRNHISILVTLRLLLTGGRVSKLQCKHGKGRETQKTISHCVSPRLARF